MLLLLKHGLLLLLLLEHGLLLLLLLKLKRLLHSLLVLKSKLKKKKKVWKTLPPSDGLKMTDA